MKLKRLRDTDLPRKRLIIDKKQLASLEKQAARAAELKAKKAKSNSTNGEDGQ
jgi:hypothetical protein